AVRPRPHLAIGPPAQRLGDAREPRREDERLDSPEDALQREQELQQEAAVEIHRARDVAEQDQPYLLALALAVAQLDQIAAREVRAQSASEVDAPAPLHRAPAAAHPVREPARDPDRELQELVELIGAEGREVLG